MMSTAYVNSNRPQFIEEKIYDLPSNQDVEQIIDKLMQLDPEFIVENQEMLINMYPNTDTYSKAMAERVIQKKRGDIPVTIVRASVIISSYQEPVKGWTDY